MKYHLVSGGCGFVGRNMVKRLIRNGGSKIIVIDDLSTGISPAKWLGTCKRVLPAGVEVYGEQEEVLFWKGDFRKFLQHLIEDDHFISLNFGLQFPTFDDVYHFAAIVGGRSKIDGDPMLVALDLAIDAEFFYWVCRKKPVRVMYPSSSAAYPVDLQTESGAVSLAEKDINFGSNLGQPDMTYGWSKLTGEYLAQIAAKYYGVSVACIRPFSGYGEDQDLSYPIPAIASRAARKEDPFEVWGSGKQGRDFVHIDDCIDCIELAMNNIHDGTAINIGSGKLTSFLEIIELMTSFAGYNPTIKPLLDKPVGVHSRYANMDYVSEKFGWKPQVSTPEGMRRVYEAAIHKYA